MSEKSKGWRSSNAAVAILDISFVASCLKKGFLLVTVSFIMSCSRTMYTSFMYFDNVTSSNFLLYLLTDFSSESLNKKLCSNVSEIFSLILSIDAFVSGEYVVFIISLALSLETMFPLRRAYLFSISSINDLKYSSGFVFSRNSESSFSFNPVLYLLIQSKLCEWGLPLA